MEVEGEEEHFREQFNSANGNVEMNHHGQNNGQLAKVHAAKRKLDEERAELRAQTQYLAPSYEELTQRYEQTLALSASTKSLADLFSVERLLEAGVFAHMEPVLDDGGEISDDEDDLFALSDQMPAEALARKRAEWTWKGDVTEKIYRTLVKQHKDERRLRRLAEQGLLLEDGQRQLKKLRRDSFLDDTAVPDKEGDEYEEDSALLQDLKRRFGKPKRKRVSPSRYTLSPMGDTNFYIDAEDDYFSYEQAARHGYVEEGGKFREKPHRGDRFALLELADLPPEMNKEEFTRAWTLIVKRDMPRAHRQYVASHQAILNNSRRLAVMCQKEMQRRAILLRRQGREANLRAKKMAREMSVWWRKHDKEQRAALKKRAAEDRKKKKEEDERREAQRQQKKLNFLITQTELYSYFIGRKMGGQETAPGPEGVPAPPPPPVVVTTRVIGRHPPKAPEPVPEAEVEDADLDPERAKEAAEIAWKRQMEKTHQFDEVQQKLRQDAVQFQAEGGQPPAGFMSPSIETIERGNNDEGDLTHPSTMPTEFITVPKMFRGKLKMYQRKGLSWLVNLYEQGINGILADEMGLGKTVQSISFLTYLAEVKNIWGPFLVLAPTSTLHNWQQEITKFCPALKVLPYWGSQKDRKIIRKYWNPRHLYTRNSPFHVLITNYNIVVRDESYFHRIKWEFMILDEAQAIKSASSARWKSLLSFSCRNRLLLTGTPIQNSMAELWALLHFIMPTLFDSHEEFTEWFSKDIESHAENKSALNEHQLSRLHMVLKPFMLRRLKSDIEFEMPKKFEVEISCGLSPRQKALYRAIKEKLNLAELLTNSFGDTTASNSELMNLVMQFRKVCNHPELFERGNYRSPWQYRPPATTEQYSTPPKPSPFKLPKLVYQELEGVQELYNYPGLILSQKSAVMRDHLDIFSPEHIHRSLFPANAPSQYSVSSPFSFSRFADLSPADLAWMARNGELERWAVHINHTRRRHERLGAVYAHSAVSLFPSAGDSTTTRPPSFTIIEEDDEGAANRVAPYRYPTAPINNRALFLVPTLLNPLRTSEVLMTPIASRRLVPASRQQQLDDVRSLIHSVRYYMPKAMAAPHELYTAMKRPVNQQRSLMFNDWTQRLLLGESTFRAPTRKHNLPRLLEEIKAPASLREVEEQGDELKDGLLSPVYAAFGATQLWVSDMGQLIADSGKMQVLDKLLIKLKAEGHRVLCYSQMTKMIDILEDYLTFRGYRYIRLDGSSKLSERRDMVEDFQSNSDIFVFLLSTRAGGLGINLTSADTVVFYDSDWNPTNDAQAMDRCHRIGQTEDVTVYRLVTKGSIEERILKRAQEKSKIHNLVIAGGTFDRSALTLKPQEMVSLLLDEEGNKAQQQQRQQQQLDGTDEKGKERVGGRRPGRKPREGIIMAAAMPRKRGRPAAPKPEGAGPPKKRTKTKKKKKDEPTPAAATTATTTTTRTEGSTQTTGSNGGGGAPATEEGTKPSAAVRKKTPAKRKPPPTPKKAKTEEKEGGM